MSTLYLRMLKSSYCSIICYQGYNDNLLLKMTLWSRNIQTWIYIISTNSLY